MSAKELLTFGYIEIGCAKESIRCGDLTMEGVSELSFEIAEDTLNGIGNAFSCNVGNSDLYEPYSAATSALAEFLSLELNLIINEQQLSGVYSLINDEPTEDSDGFDLIESRAGEFGNESGIHNGKIYLRHYWAEGDETYGECVGLSKDQILG